MSRLHSDPLPVSSRPPDELLEGVRPSAEQVALVHARHAVDNAVRSIFELARSLEFLSDAIRGFETDPIIEFREIDNARNRFAIERAPAGDR